MPISKCFIDKDFVLFESFFVGNDGLFLRLLLYIPTFYFGYLNFSFKTVFEKFNRANKKAADRKGQPPMIYV